MKTFTPSSSKNFFTFFLTLYIYLGQHNDNQEQLLK